MEEKFQGNIIIKIILAVCYLITITSLYRWLSFDVPQKPLAGKGGENNIDLQIGGNFELTDQESNTLNSESLKGKLSLINLVLLIALIFVLLLCKN